jgi:uncharacterized membrane protein YeaQ/YmgE (transglycosylase-associated protein family)
MAMGALAWIVVGVTAGFMAKAISPGGRNEDAGFLGTMLLGVVGAVIGGWVWNLFLADPGESAFDFGSLTVAFIGAVMVISFLRALDRKPTTY